MRTFIPAVFAFAAVINGLMWYRLAPVMAAPVADASWLDKRKVQDKLPVKVVPTVAYRLDPPVASLTAPPERTSLPWSCETIRNAVANLTKEQIERMARIYRLSEQQKADARRCLKEKRA